MERKSRQAVTEAWRVWKVGLNGRTPTPAEMLRQALVVDRQFGKDVVFPK